MKRAAYSRDGTQKASSPLDEAPQAVVADVET